MFITTGYQKEISGAGRRGRRVNISLRVSITLRVKMLTIVDCLLL
jgi:hypothetical protein